jgi:uncharacterized phage infection (PIP) family protein YhgE
MSLIDAYRQKLEAQIHEHKAQLDLLKAKAKRVAAQSKFVGHQELAEADKHLEHVKAKFNELKGAGGHAWGEIKTGVKKALADLQVSTKKAANHFNPPKPKATPGRAKAKAKVVHATAKLTHAKPKSARIKAKPAHAKSRRPSKPAKPAKTKRR